MSWNEEPKNNPSDPNKGPPELDKLLSDFFKKFTKKSDKQPSSGTTPSQNNAYHLKVLSVGIVCGLLLLWFIFGIFIVSPAEKGVILRFGQYQETVDAGPHWIPRFIDSEITVNTQKISTYSYDAQMLTQDQNIVNVAVAVQYRISNVKDYLFNAKNPERSLEQATASALRQVVGSTTLDNILTTGRAAIRDAVSTQLNDILKNYNVGIEVTDVALQPAGAPAEVKTAFDDAIRAQEDEARYQNQAEAYANNVLPVAQGKATRMLEEAKAYQEQTVLQAEAEVARFNAVYAAYQQAPIVTKERMYLATLESIYARSNKIFIDTKNSNVLYLPIEAALKEWQTSLTKQNSVAAPLSLTPTPLMPTSPMSNNASDMPSNTQNPDSLVGLRSRP
jgi:membrane protease subunit HflK